MYTYFEIQFSEICSNDPDDPACHPRPRVARRPAPVVLVRVDDDGPARDGVGPAVLQRDDAVHQVDLGRDAVAHGMDVAEVAHVSLVGQGAGMRFLKKKMTEMKEKEIFLRATL